MLKRTGLPLTVGKSFGFWWLEAFRLRGKGFAVQGLRWAAAKEIQVEIFECECIRNPNLE